MLYVPTSEYCAVERCLVTHKFYPTKMDKQLLATYDHRDISFVMLLGEVLAEAGHHTLDLVLGNIFPQIMNVQRTLPKQGNSQMVNEGSSSPFLKQRQRVCPFSVFIELL